MKERKDPASGVRKSSVQSSFFFSVYSSASKERREQSE